MHPLFLVPYAQISLTTVLAMPQGDPLRELMEGQLVLRWHRMSRAGISLGEFARRHSVLVAQLKELLEALDVDLTPHIGRSKPFPCDSSCDDSAPVTAADAIRNHLPDCAVRVRVRDALCVAYEGGRDGNTFVSIKSLAREHGISDHCTRAELAMGGATIRPPHRPKPDHLWRRLPV